MAKLNVDKLKKFYLFKGELYPVNLTLSEARDSDIKVHCVKGIVVVEDSFDIHIGNVMRFGLVNGVFDLHTGEQLGELSDIQEVYIEQK